MLLLLLGAGCSSSSVINELIENLSMIHGIEWFEQCFHLSLHHLKLDTKIRGQLRSRHHLEGKR